ALDAGDARQLRSIQGTARHDHEARADVVAAVGAEPPALDLLVPAYAANQRVEERAVVEAELMRDPPELLEDLEAIDVLPRRHVARLFEQRDVAIGVVVALQPGKAVPVPAAAEVTGQIDAPERTTRMGWPGSGRGPRGYQPGPLQMIGGQEARPARPED